MEFRVGTDIIEVERIEKSIKRYKEKFLEKIYTNNEIEYCNKKSDIKYERFAGRFAAKEAVYKALSEQFGTSIQWKNIEIVNDNSGRPKVVLKNLDLKNVIQIDISISHVKQFAIANVIVSIK